METGLIIQWVILVVSSVLLVLLAPLSRTVEEFFRATSKSGKSPGFFLLTGSLVISWIFAKSITNATDLGLKYGAVGGFAYAAYYLSFVVAGIVIFRMRTKGAFASIHQFLQSRFGRGAMVLFSLLIGFRLFNEVWSNTMVIGSYFGEQGSWGYYLAIGVFTVLTLAYSLKGGLRSSLLTDLIQFVLFGLLLVVILGFMLPDANTSLPRMMTTGSWGPEGGVFLLLAAFLQVFSYPFHDPVMTDRGFIGKPKVTLYSFLAAGAIGFLLILLFSTVGIYGQELGLEGNAAVGVAKSLGLVLMLPMNFIMVTSAASTLDSSFSSFSKLGTSDLLGEEKTTVSRGRWLMVIMAVVGTIPIFLNPKIISATTVSGTMVMGLAPVFLLWRLRAPALSFFLSVGSGILFGILYALKIFPKGMFGWEGPYADLFVVNLLGLLVCFGVFLIPWLVVKLTKKD